MGCVDSVRFNHFPQQGTMYQKRVLVCFHYDTTKQIGGFVVRDDSEHPWRTIIKLDDGRYVDTSECQYTEDS